MEIEAFVVSMFPPGFSGDGFMSCQIITADITPAQAREIANQDGDWKRVVAIAPIVTAFVLNTSFDPEPDEESWINYL